MSSMPGTYRAEDPEDNFEGASPLAGEDPATGKVRWGSCPYKIRGKPCVLEKGHEEPHADSWVPHQGEYIRLNCLLQQKGKET